MALSVMALCFFTAVAILVTTVIFIWRKKYTSRSLESEVAARYRYDQLPLVVKISMNKTLSETIPSQVVKIPTRQNAKIQSKPLEILKLKTRLVMKDAQKMISKEEFGTPQPHNKPMKVVMVMGATGAGKSTLINGMVNYILGVKVEHPFRFKLICDETTKSQAHSQTNVITAYTFHWQEGFAVPYSLTIIDTPGFGDTRGIERDRLIAKQVKELFSIKGSNGIDMIHAIGFVTQSSLARLTPTQKYVFDSILSIFGNDIKKNIFVMATFADGATPPVIEAIEAGDIPFAEYFPFNNSALYEIATQKFTKMFWDMGCESFQDFFQNLEKASAISLQLTREVLKEREQLEVIISGMQPKIQQGLSKIETLRDEETMLRGKESDIAANKNFKYNVKVTKQRKKDLPTGTYVTNCLTCNFTCHKPCGIPNDGEKYKCAAMDNGGEDNAKCTVCPGKCGWGKHVNNPYFFEIYEETETRTSDELFKRYNVATTDKNAVDAIITALHDELSSMSRDVYSDIREARCCIDRLGEIALKPNPMTEVEYINLLIESEKQEMKPGFQERVRAYMTLKSQAEIMAKMSDAQIDKELKEKDSKKWWKLWRYVQ